MMFIRSNIYNQMVNLTKRWERDTKTKMHDDIAKKVYILMTDFIYFYHKIVKTYFS